MDQSGTTFDTFVIERAFAAPPARVFAAFADPAVKQRWFAQGQTHDVERYTMRFEVGGREQASYRFRPGTPFPGVLLESDGEILDIVPGRRIVIASTMTIGGRRISAALQSFELSGADAGTRMLFTHQAAFFEGADGPAMRRAGWEQLFGQLQGALADAA
jgi:uncharacterized protein YndB with AHSA1/START domain